MSLLSQLVTITVTMVTEGDLSQDGAVVKLAHLNSKESNNEMCQRIFHQFYRERTSS